MAVQGAAVDVAARIDRLRAVLAGRGLDAAVSPSPATIAYLAGFQALLYSRPTYLLITPARTELVVPGLEEEHAGQVAAIDSVTVYYEHPEKGTPGENGPDTLAAVLSRRGVKRVGLEYASAPIALRERLEEDGLSTADISAELIRMRLLKDAAEIALMRQAATLARIGVMATLAAAAGGRSQLEIESIGTNAILEAAPELTPAATINLLHFTTSGPETSLPHLITTTRRLGRPDLAIHSRQVSVDGERAELERTFAVGGMDAETRRVFDAAEEAQLAAIAAIRPGVPSGRLRRVQHPPDRAWTWRRSPRGALHPVGCRGADGGRDGSLDRAGDLRSRHPRGAALRHRGRHRDRPRGHHRGPHRRRQPYLRPVAAGCEPGGTSEHQEDEHHDE